MLKNTTIAISVAGMIVALSACGSSDDAADAAVEAQGEPEIALSPIQQANFERVNRDEFFTNLAALKADTSGDSLLGAQLDKLDRDESGKLDAGEFALGNNADVSAQDKPATDKLLRSFFALDTNGDLMLSEEELTPQDGNNEEAEAADTGASDEPAE